MIEWVWMGYFQPLPGDANAVAGSHLNSKIASPCSFQAASVFLISLSAPQVLKFLMLQALGWPSGTQMLVSHKFSY